MKRRIADICLRLGVMAGIFLIMNGNHAYAAETEWMQCMEGMTDEPTMPDSEEKSEEEKPARHGWVQEGEEWQYLNGSPRWDGYVGLNCTGFVAFLIPDWSKPGADCHIGIYWGDYPGHNQFWHQVDTNKISHIYAGTPVIRYYIIKIGM